MSNFFEEVLDDVNAVEEKIIRTRLCLLETNKIP